MPIGDDMGNRIAPLRSDMRFEGILVWLTMRVGAISPYLIFIPPPAPTI
jgi:hypothetical protein